MTDTITCCAGIDVSKDRLDIALYPGGQHLSVDYTKQGLAALDRFVAEHKVARIGFEASGGYEWRLLAHLRKGKVAAARFQPGQIKAFGKSRLQRAKNDRLDALLIAQFTASVDELPKLPDAKLDGLADHLTYIEQIEDRTATLKTMLEASRNPRIRHAQMVDIARLELRRSAELALLVKTIGMDTDLARKLSLIVSIRGIGERSALALLVRMPEIGSLTRQEAAALAGVAPYDNDSGTRNGRRCVAGGRQRLRKSLFMAAFCATRWNNDLRQTYLHLIERGKHHLTAVIAVARKLVILANAVVARDRPWTDDKPTI